MTNKVYWGLDTKTNATLSELLSVPPTLLSLEFIKSTSPCSGNLGFEEYRKCPLHIEYVRNTLVFRAPSSVKITNTEGAISIDKGQQYFDDNIYVGGSIKDCKPLIHLHWFWYLFSDKDLEVSLIPPTFHTSEFSESVTILPAGPMNIHRWLRPLQPVFLMNKSTVNIKAGDVLFYVKVHTPGALHLVDFTINEGLLNLAKNCVNVKLNKSKISLKPLYDLFTKHKYQKKVLNLIKKNVR